ncbi:MAG: acyl-CoA dehydrogenase [Burkholderiales bacterium 35-55-47]|jgi:butyryl-CoA dehydrogenase|uniref:acyl-CoA dehydrogenase n=1 Tax=Limnohabitans sp. TaxID=1907725 RepID=UPI000BD4E22C|nr:acyl-CoA dehydrogenase [Limnohabitans sp.]OYY19567.1 MAG: acyl-CoA dehydrogenase [Burkholderiales bacterium 35-55-47]OYZ74822.1 MAG: acyl-CoA dehydrogenase [Burkholderiales bacterium 24-55-52]OZB01290.1 MAG: acyl-CoA dehydrogenase [Burkholderiales bacterium 39-55-53]HQR85745.1 acyl-CoA dehydrogenase [Limnohabitans sp.]HQS26339.1 acyl-CoA dehydrogenase [Limnohabitans sp.]
MSLRPTVDFLLYDWLKVNNLQSRERFADHSRETFDAVLDTCERIARDKFAPFNRLVDIEEPKFDGEKVILPQATHEAYKAYAESGMLSAAQDYDVGGMQLPYTVEAAANAFFSMASVSIGSGLLTSGNANLLMAHGTERQKQVFALNEFSGRFSGTMCLSEPQAGSSLSDITTRAIPDGAGFESDALGPRYRLKGNKMWISAGEHELSENIIHLVLAKIPDPNGQLVPGVKGISLFIVPKKLVNPEGQLTGERNDVALAGLNHKCGWRGTTNTLLNFGEGKYPVGGQRGAVGYLVGQPGEGLKCMFHMMNEARIGVGMAATMLGLAGYYASLDYAKNRPQGRALGTAGKDAQAPQVRIIEHADIKRMLLAQKAYCEGALALALYCARLVDEQHTASAEDADVSRLLLEVLTPIVKSFPSQWCLEANSLAIQIHGGYGYTRDFPVEQYWRDNRLNMIHEGTHGIQAMDLLGRKVLMENGRGLQLLAQRMSATADKAQADWPDEAAALRQALQQVGQATQAAWIGALPAQALANAVPYLQAFGHTVVAWIWLDVVSTLGADDSASADGRRAACRYFYRYELPQIQAWLAVVKSRDQTCADLAEDAF